MHAGITAREGPCQAGSPPACGRQTFGRRLCESHGETGKGGVSRSPGKASPAPSATLATSRLLALPHTVHLVRLCLVCPTTEPASPVRLTGSAHRTAAGLPSPASVFPSVEWVEAGGEPDPKMCRSLERCPDPFFFFFQS